MENLYDVIIIGSGPAGLSAAIYAKRAKLSSLTIEANFASGGQVLNTYEVDNYPGLPGISGMDLGSTLRAHAEKMGAEFSRERVKELVLDEEIKIVRTRKNEYHAKTVILATGAEHRALNVPGEKELSGMGVSDCATGDGAFFNDKTVAVIGGGNTAMDAARAAIRSGAASATLVYRRTKRYMPADAEELELAMADGVRFLELAAPVAQENGRLKCERMTLGAPDEKGRRSPLPTGELMEFDCDTVIAAVGEQVEGELFTANGIAVNAKDIPGFCTNLENVYVGGDAMRGPATVVEGIADAQRFADIVIGAPHTLSVPENAHVTREEAISKKGILSPPTVGCEGNRCLHCNTVCQVCADVCPNRANVVIELPGGRHEILHVDRMCNECGNCAVFCPYDSAPYRDKFTLFLTRSGFDESQENQGFLPLGGGKVLIRLEGKVFEADPASDDRLPPDIALLIRTVLKEYSYLL